MVISLIIPTLNAENSIDALIDSILKQTRIPHEILVIDSQSEDETVEHVKRYPEVKVITVNRASFDHGGTRDMALRFCAGDIVFFMTQDAIPVDEYYIERLLTLFDDERVAAVGGRQIAKPDATRWEQLVREHNYPAFTRVWDRSAIERMGVRAFMISDTCAAYRRDAYLAVGGFDYPIMINEDMLMAQKLLAAGYAVGYNGDAAVYHSHNMTLLQQYRRNYVVGRTMKRYEERFCHVKEMTEGIKLVKAVLKQLISEKRILGSIAFCLDCAARLLGNRVGKWREKRKMNSAACLNIQYDSVSYKSCVIYRLTNRVTLYIVKQCFPAEVPQQ